MISMFEREATNIIAALDKSLAVIQFDPTGKILRANHKFCELMGYTQNEIIGQHHRMFAEPAFAESQEYAAFWEKLQRGEFVSDEFKRLAKGGREVFIQATYNPIRSGNGKVYKVIKFASDITEAKCTAVAMEGKVNAISRAQAVIEFSIDGTIKSANENFLVTLGYELSEIVGRHHRMFVEPAYANSPDYQNLWARLARGEFVADECKRIGKGGRQVYIQASYNPIFDPSGKVVGVVKFATDVTPRVEGVHRLGQSLALLASGDLQQRVRENLTPALEPIRASLNSSLETLQTALASVNNNADTIQSGTEQIRIAAEDLARRTEQQAAALEETSAALSEITATVNEASRSAEDAGQMVKRTKDDAERSGEIVSRAIEAMNQIEMSSNEISKIISVIDEIAFQTNLLALNAGVEAARAGEAGRGFAVVAQEVRGLAQRSAQAAKEIKNLISTSRMQVQSGVSLVAETGTSLSNIVEKVGQVNDHVLRIVASAKGQAIGLQEISVAMSTLDQGTQQNAAMSEQSTAATNELAKQATLLKQMLVAFKIGYADASAPRHRSPARDLVGRVKTAFASR